MKNVCTELLAYRTFGSSVADFDDENITEACYGAALALAVRRSLGGTDILGNIPMPCIHRVTHFSSS